MKQILTNKEAEERYNCEKYCHADTDGDCTWEGCPQLRDGEPEKTGRHCPLDFNCEEI
jgi:hypothetical protein